MKTVFISPEKVILDYVAQRAERVLEPDSTLFVRLEIIRWF